MWPVIIGAAMSAAQYKQQQDKEQRDRELAAETQRYSPWTGMRAGGIQEADAVGTIGSGVMAGYQMEQGMDAQSAQKDYQNKKLANEDRYLNIMENQGKGSSAAPSQGPMMSGWGGGAQMGPHQDPNMYRQPQPGQTWIAMR
jgi:hypothetical protein